MLLPRKTVPAKVSISCCLLKYWLLQLQILNYSSRSQIKVFLHYFGQLLNIQGRLKNIRQRGSINMKFVSVELFKIITIFQHNFKCLNFHNNKKAFFSNFKFLTPFSSIIKRILPLPLLSIYHSYHIFIFYYYNLSHHYYI